MRLCSIKDSQEQKFWDNQQQYMETMAKEFDSLKSFLSLAKEKKGDVFDVNVFWRKYNSVKEALGNFNNDMTSIACLMAKEWLFQNNLINCECMSKADILESSVNAGGFDIDIINEDNQRIIGEVKTTSFYKKDFGAMQKKGIIKDLDGLEKGFKEKQKNHISPKHKFMFVTDSKVFERICVIAEGKTKEKRLRRVLSKGKKIGVTLVLLGADEKKTMDL